MIAGIKTAPGTNGSAAASEAARAAPSREPAAAFTVENARYEIKTVCERMGLEQVLAELRLRGVAFRPLHPRRTVQSIYLDTASARAMEENLAGVSRREKFRFRWYGSEGSTAAGALERKIRDNRLGWKETLPIEGTVDVQGASRAGFMRRLMQAATPAWRERLGGLEPAQWVVYERDYLATADGAIRMTIDRDLRFYDQRLVAALSRRSPRPAPQMMVIECKAAASHEEQLHDLLGGFPLVVDKCSKFVMASGGGGPIVSMLQV
jgi:hypothetical protein